MPKSQTIIVVTSILEHLNGFKLCTARKLIRLILTLWVRLKLHNFSLCKFSINSCLRVIWKKITTFLSLLYWNYSFVQKLNGWYNIIDLWRHSGDNIFYFCLFSLPLGPVGLVNVAVEEGTGHTDWNKKLINKSAKFNFNLISLFSPSPEKPRVMARITRP